VSSDFIRERLDDPDSKKAEALAWLEGSAGKNTLGELMTTDESIDIIKAAYEAGAEEIFAIEIDEYDESDGVYENTGKLIVRLPSDASARERVVQWCAKQAEAQGFDGEKDEGQTHIFVALD
jgi:hypothetical protein